MSVAQIVELAPEALHAAGNSHATSVMIPVTGRGGAQSRARRTNLGWRLTSISSPPIKMAAFLSHVPAIGAPMGRGLTITQNEKMGS